MRTSSLTSRIYINKVLYMYPGAAVADWLSSWLAGQEDLGSIPGLAT